MTVVTEQYRLAKYDKNSGAVWDSFVSESLAGTFLHTWQFLSYHGDKFDDRSIMIYDQENTLRAIFPAAVDPGNKEIIVSHPGITYGGLLHDGWLRGQRCLDVLNQLCDFYVAAGFKEIIYKAVPWIYHRSPAQDDIYALFRLGADRYRVDLSATVDLQNRIPVTERRSRALKKAAKSDLQISDDFNYMPAYWQILSQNLKTKHDKAPVHSVQELTLLKEKFPQQIELITAVSGAEVVAGSLLFHCPMLTHAQYFASSPMGREMGALDLVVEHSLEKSMQQKKRFFDFGISTDDQGQHLNDTLHTFKSEFGAGASIYEFYKIQIEPNNA